ncbi:unnamed protein product [Paramecium octaurelia]|uniref:H-type lectin domain-containing protein n=1 Tax=Paramecium octaurelia TaxID=43137 RepID=A0A8S1XXV2_PAROT|nr:unnamed protein product [Paramecium octaurelia]
MLFVNLFIQQAFCLSSYQSGFKTLNCINVPEVVTFPKQFSLIPQIIFTLSQINFLSNQAQFEYQTTSITTEGFIIDYNCSNKQILQVIVKWEAFVDQRIQVINVYNRKEPKNETLSHNNPNAQFGFLTLTSFSYFQQINFTIEIIKITPLEVFVGISNTNNLLEIGYQIILGIDEAFVSLGQLSATQDVKIAYPIFPDKFFITPYLGFILTPNDVINLISSQDISSEPGKVVYQIFEKPGDGLYTRNTHLRIWVSRSFSILFKPFRYNKIQTVQKSRLDQDIQSSIQLKFDQKTQIYQDKGNYRILIDNSTQLITVGIQIICEQDQKKSIEFPLNSNYKNGLSIQYNCQKKIKLIEYQIDLIVQSVAIQELIIVVDNSKFQIKQILYNEFEEQIILLTAFI